MTTRGAFSRLAFAVYIFAGVSFAESQAPDAFEAPQPARPVESPPPVEYDCSAGCASTWQPVCGSDGMTYSNTCLAQCQGLALRHTGPCNGDTMTGAWAHVDPGSPAQLLPAEALERFAKEDFRYAAKVQLFRGSALEPQPTNQSQSNTPNTTQAPASTPPSWQPSPSFVRVTKEGYLYVSTSDAYLPEAMDESLYGPAAGAGSDTTLRSRPSRSLLAVLGVDERISCPRYPTYPFSAVGQILTHSSSGLFVCSGTLIGPDVVLTAAHCVYNRKTKAFLDVLDFAPARYRSSYSDEIFSPYGALPWTHVTLYSNYMDANTPDANVWDLAVIQLPSRVGDVAGWMGLQPPCLTNASETFVATTAGYPVDKPGGTCMTAQCQVTQDTCDSAYLFHECDTYEGQSGSSMWTLSFNTQVGPWSNLRFAPYVRAVHNLEWTKQVTGSNGDSGYVPYTNSAVAITPLHYAAIKSWIAPSFAGGEPETKVTWYPLPPTMVVSTSLGVTDGAAANASVVDGYAPASTDAGTGTSPSNVSSAATTAGWNWRLFKR